MKKRIIAWAVLLSVCAAALGLWCSAAAGKTARTLPCEDEGLILSITTFDGKSESKPFLKCFGHTWIGLDNRTGHTVYLKDRAIPDGEKEDGANLCVLEVQGKNVRLETEGGFSWGKEYITVRAVRYTFPGLHAALTKLTGSEIVSTEIAVSRTQLLTVQCADETRYYRDGQQEDVVTQEQGVFEKG